MKIEKQLTAVEWLWNALLVSGFEEIKNVEGFYHLAKQKEKEKEEQYNNMLSMLQETYRRLEPLGTISLRKQIKEVLTFKSE